MTGKAWQPEPELAGHSITELRLESGLDWKTSGPAPFDLTVPPLSSETPLVAPHLPNQCHVLVTNCSHTQACGGNRKVLSLQQEEEELCLKSSRERKAAGVKW